MARAIAGLFNDRAAAEQAINDLKSAGFDGSRIGVVMQDKQQTKEFAQEHGTQSTETAVGGGIIGGTAGALLAATGALVIPGVGPFITGGILASLIGGAAGWLVGGLVGLGVPKEEAQYYEDRVHAGSTLVTVDAQGRDAEARQILLRDGAEDLQDRGYGGGYDTTMTSDVNAAPTSHVAMGQTAGTMAPAPQMATGALGTTSGTLDTSASTASSGMRGGVDGDDTVVVDNSNAPDILIDRTGKSGQTTGGNRS